MDNEKFDINHELLNVSDIYKEYNENKMNENETHDKDNGQLESFDLSESLDESNSNNESIKDIAEESIKENDEQIDKSNLEGEALKIISDTLNNALCEENDNEEHDEEKNSNMLNLVTFKGTKRGIEIYLSNDEDITFDEIIDNLTARIEATKETFKDVRCGIVIKGRKLTNKEEEILITLLRRNMSISIDYINTEDFYQDDVIRNEVKDTKKDYAHTMFYHGTLRSGQSLTSDRSIVIFGDINPGSEVIAGGNLIVMGSLRGIVQAGTRSNDAYIVAFDMNPKQLRIGDHIARAADEGDDERIKKPHMAYLNGEQICIEPIDGTFNLIEKEC